MRGMVTGALVGLGLGALVSRAAEPDEKQANPTEVASGTDGASAGTSEDKAAQGAQQEKGNPYGILLLGILAFIAFFLVRRSRRRRRFLFK
jgi:hypothetical protein